MVGRAAGGVNYGGRLDALCLPPDRAPGDDEKCGANALVLLFLATGGHLGNLG